MLDFIMTFIRKSPVMFLLIAITSGFTSMSAFALASDAKQPIRLVADKATYNEKTGVTSYSGNVVISQGSFQMTAQRLVVTLDNNRRIASAVATGQPATMQQKIDADKGLAKGQASKITYNANTGIITLLGGARLNQAGASISGNSIRYSLKAGDFEAKGQGSNRVELVFPPSAGSRQAVK